MGYNFIVELSPKADKFELDRILDGAKHLIDRCTGKIILTSHTIPGTTITGLTKALNCLARLEGNKPIFTLTCNDVNRVNIDETLYILRERGVGDLLVVTGENYALPECHKELHFEDSEQLISYIARQRKVNFDSIGMATYPANGIEKEICRLQKKLANLPINAVDRLYFQYVEDLDLLADFSSAMSKHLELEYLSKMYYVPIFDSPESYLRALRLMKIPNKLAMFVDDTRRPLDPTEYKSYARARIHDYFVRLGAFRTNFVLCPFGLNEFACNVLERFLLKYPCLEPNLRTKTNKRLRVRREQASHERDCALSQD